MACPRVGLSLISVRYEAGNFVFIVYELRSFIDITASPRVADHCDFR